jgi:hypothetical protein
MKAYINVSGQLVIEPEDSTQKYALNSWHEKNYLTSEDLSRAEVGHIRGSALLIKSAREVES